MWLPVPWKNYWRYFVSDCNFDIIIQVTRKIPKKPNSKLSPAQIMHNRFVQMQKQAQEEAGRSVSKK